MALPKTYRFTSKKEFDFVKKNGKIIHAPLFSSLVLEDKNATIPKFGVIVSKRIDKKAVVRNRVRRIIYEAVRLLLPEVRQNIRVIFLAKQAVKGKKTQEVIRVMRGIREIAEQDL